MSNSPVIRRAALLGLGLGVLVSAGTAKAQNVIPAARPQASNESNANPAQTHPQAGSIHRSQNGVTRYFGSWRFRIEDYNWFPPPKGNGAYTYAGSTLRFGVQHDTPTTNLLLEMSQPTLINLPTQASQPSPIGNMGQGANYYAADQKQSASLFLKQAYARFNQISHGDSSSSLQMGRFEFGDALENPPANRTVAYLKRYRVAQRLLAPSTFTYIGRSFDGLKYAYHAPGYILTALAAYPTRGVYDLDGWDTLTKVKTIYLDSTFPQPGIRRAGEGRMFAIYYRDDRTNLSKVDNQSSAAHKANNKPIEIGTIGGDYIGTAAAGPGDLNLVLWGAGQFGAWGNQSQASYAYAAELGYKFSHAPWEPWLRIGYDVASGDNNAKDSVHQTFVPLLYTSTSYAHFPFYNTMNLKDLFGEVILQPARKLEVRIDYHNLTLANSQDLWYSGSGAYNNSNFGYSSRPSGGHNDLAHLADIAFDYQARRNLAFTLYFGYARGGNVVTTTYTGKDAIFAYLETNLRF